MPPVREQAAEIIADPRVTRHDLGAGGRVWRIQIAAPPGAPPAQGWPALFLLDGAATFPLAWHQVHATPGLALVGIGHPGPGRFDVVNRFRDYTATPADPPRDRSGAPLATGGRAEFLDLLAGPVMDSVAARLPLDMTAATLFGHSLAGLFVVYAALARPGLVRRYVAADPSLWWDHGAVLRDRALYRAGGETGLLVETAGQVKPEGSPRPPGWTQAAPTPEALFGGLDGLRAWHRHVPEATHGSILRAAMADTLRFAADGTPPPEARAIP